jgi:hypothetical protein
MEHDEATRSLAVERYLLGELSGMEMDDFEEHMFTCTTCAEAVTSGATFVDNAREVLREQPAVRLAPARLPWWKRLSLPVLAPSFAALMLLCIVGYQRVLIERSSHLQGMASFALKGVSRGEPTVIKVPPQAEWINMQFDVPVDSPSGFTCEIRDSRGSKVLSAHVPQIQTGQVNLLVRRSDLPAGDYILRVTTEGPTPADAGQFPFTTQYP